MNAHTPGPWEVSAGMSLRDYFAAHALPAVYAHSVRVGNDLQEAIAQEAFEIADAMLGETSLAAAAADLRDSLTEFVALYDDTGDMLSPETKRKLARAEAALEKAGVTR